jgi:sarcosine oxidase delta subunit
MSRSFVNVTWNNASEVYDGSQQQNKHFNPNGTAATHLYADQEVKPKAKKKRSIVERVSLVDSHYNRLEALSLELDKELEIGNVSFEDYAYLRQTMDGRLEKAWTRLAKARGFDEQEDESVSHNSFNQNVDLDSKNYGKQSVSSGVSLAYDSVNMPAVFDNLKDDNFFKKVCYFCLTARQVIAKILPTATK